MAAQAFARIETTEIDFGKWFRTDLELKRAANRDNRVEHAKLLDAWQAARRRIQAEDEAESTALAAGALGRTTYK